MLWLPHQTLSLQITSECFIHHDISWAGHARAWQMEINKYLLAKWINKGTEQFRWANAQVYQSLKNSFRSWVVMTRGEIKDQINCPGLQNQFRETQVNQNIKVCELMWPPSTQTRRRSLSRTFHLIHPLQPMSPQVLLPSFHCWNPYLLPQSLCPRCNSSFHLPSLGRSSSLLRILLLGSSWGSRNSTPLSQSDSKQTEEIRKEAWQREENGSFISRNSSSEVVYSLRSTAKWLILNPSVGKHETKAGLLLRRRASPKRKTEWSSDVDFIPSKFTNQVNTPGQELY